MKAIVFDCLRDLVLTAFGEETWQAIAGESVLGANVPQSLSDDHADSEVLALFARICELTGLDFGQACEAFGLHWVSRYLPAHYPSIYDGIDSARALILKLDAIHAAIPQQLPGALPPRHSYAWKDEDTLLIGYRSDRDLTELFDASLRAVGTHFGEQLSTTIIDRQTVELRFGS